MSATYVLSSQEAKNPTEQLTNVASVAKYLETTPFPVRHIRRIQLGSTNFTYRLFFEAPYGQSLARTAILKYAAPYTADKPRVSFNSERQIYEARAMTLLPWHDILTTQFPQPNTSPEDYIPKVKIPKVYFEDQENHVLVMEDGTPRNGTDEPWDEVSHLARIFFEQLPESDNKYETSKIIGRQLGTFLAHLHTWGKDPKNSKFTVTSFAGNTSAKDLTVDETFTGFFKSLDKAGLCVSSSVRNELEVRLLHLEQEITENLETLTMGDFWLGNVLLSFDSRSALERIYIIDWEFVMLAPVFLDIGNFIGEVFLINYFESNDSVYIYLLESFLESYQQINENINIEDILGYAGAHIMMALPRRITSPRSRATTDNASPCAQHAVDFLTLGHGFTDTPAEKRKSFEAMLDSMRDRRRQM